MNVNNRVTRTLLKNKKVWKHILYVSAVQWTLYVADIGYYTSQK